MSKELIEKLREYADGEETPFYVMGLMNDAADALEAKAAPVGEREAFEAAWSAGEFEPAFMEDFELCLQCFQAGAAYQRSQQPQPTEWQPSGADYDRSIHMNPDAKAWADFFVATSPGLADKHDLMLGWFANAMMAMHDHLKAKQPQSAEAVAEDRHEAVKAIHDVMASVPCASLYSLAEAVFDAGYTPQPSAGVVMLEQCAKWCDEQAASDWHGRTASDMVREFARLNGKEVGRE